MRYGSLINSISESSADVINPEVGMKATILGWSDRHPAMVTDVIRTKDGRVKAIVVQRVEWTPQPFPSGYAETVHIDRPSGGPETFKVATHGKNKGRVDGLMLGRHDAYRDPHF